MSIDAAEPVSVYHVVKGATVRDNLKSAQHLLTGVVPS